MKSEGDGSSDPRLVTAFEAAASTSRVMNTAASVSVDAEATAGVPSASSIVAVAIGHPVKGQAKQNKASVKATCKPKKPRKLPERRPKEAMLAYR